MTMQSSAAAVEVNNLFTVRVLVNSQNIYINNAEATIEYPSDLVEVQSVDSKSSIFTMWVEPPSFSNASGVLSFNGGITNPGYNGAGGRVLTVVFKAKAAGTASLFFSGPAVKASDGLGTDVLSGQNSLTITITSGKASTPPEKTEPVTTPKTPTTPETSNALTKLIISSPTHPDPNTWYSLPDATMQWVNPAGTQALQVTLTTDKTTVPSKSIPSDLTSRDIAGISDGTWYYGMRYKTSRGWSPVSVYALRIDTQPPHDITLNAENNDDGSERLAYSAKDETSGVHNFEMSVDGEKATTLAADGTSGKATLTLSVGKHVIALAAYDKAGNKAQQSFDVVVKAAAAPKFTDYINPVEFGGSIFAKAESPYPNSQFTVTLKSPFGSIVEYDVQSDQNGRFSFTSERLKVAGNYEVWAAAMNTDGTRGPLSPKLIITVSKPLPLIRSIAAVILSPISLLILLFILLALLAAIGWYKYFVLRWQYRALKKQIEQKPVRVRRAKVITPPKDTDELV